MTAPARLSVLALDCAGASCSAALHAGGGLRARRLDVMDRGQSERMVPMIEEVMAEAGLDYGALDLLAVTRGPGGFTGVRIGLATARGLALASGRPLVGVTNFEAVAAAVPAETARGRALLVALESKRAEIYVQLFDRRPGQESWQSLTPPAAILPEDMADYAGRRPVLMAGDAVPRFARDPRAAADWDLVLSGHDGPADAAAVARLVAGRPRPADAAAPTPVYLRAPDVSRPGSPAPRG